MRAADRRQIPTWLTKILARDVYFTDEFVKFMEKFLSLKQCLLYYYILEISCHGICWLGISFILIRILNNKSLYQMQVNLVIGLLFDIVLVAVLKAITRRRRPNTNDDPFSLGPDKYSFPSGHASRALFILYFFESWNMSSLYALPLLTWSFSVCLSRIMLRRHHMLDVLVGACLGVFEGAIMRYFYFGQETCVYLISWFCN
ncbi:polyisoprenoid diphosphate/phosphate phosphohydrolase PLPP6-like [Linepithema humile]|uniref:polyisoprenoid diphosphate/phosphate phosphohydrolase PLPP6-like n=1 Tax=Linepithema humile TaxID=83485 RepID=UPI00062312E3|nr:PREDICTED: presqualene diphosphate phosphatase-like [Linepithema humile]